MMSRNGDDEDSIVAINGKGIGFGIGDVGVGIGGGV